MKRLALLVVVAACGGGGPKKTEPVTNTATSSVPPALFAALFVDGKSFTYAVKTETEYWDDSNPKADQSGNVHDVTNAKMSCTVHGMQNFARAIAARLECDTADGGDSSPDAVWVATATGIWRLAEFPLDDAAIAALDPKQMLLPAQPVETTVNSNDEDTGESWSVEHEGGGAWCWNHTFVSGDEGGGKICFAPGKGLVEGGSYFAGGSSKDITYQLAQ